MVEQVLGGDPEDILSQKELLQVTALMQDFSANAADVSPLLLMMASQISQQSSSDEDEEEETED
ncbi:hypothetical protein HHL16_13200 [Pseudoflavitalea sp. G-6-1-2]|uniref:hypothetical protein n=1 Tax=Pseudoflavitalea sp. G-6-1-2 TaxID=2728841 RepID=UPI00146CBBB4|nr:hypothetical protein [Pseudoflavitalea sp. G-6-1-2]NML21841.1 hypothetical protein [Pseudoflavitalea sp. G-6-1-2]